MRKGRSVPRMLVLCLLLAGCGTGKDTAEAALQPYRDMAGCQMEAVVRWSDGSGGVWDFTLRCDYVPEGIGTVEVLAPETAAGVTAEIEGETLRLRYQDLCLGAGTLSDRELSPMQCLPELMAAAREGWLLSESRETAGKTPCLRLTLDRTGEGGGKRVSTLYLREEDGIPLYGEIAVEGEVVLRAEFTDFTFTDEYATIGKNTD